MEIRHFTGVSCSESGEQTSTVKTRLLQLGSTFHFPKDSIPSLWTLFNFPFPLSCRAPPGWRKEAIGGVFLRIMGGRDARQGGPPCPGGRGLGAEGCEPRASTMPRAERLAAWESELGRSPSSCPLPSMRRARGRRPSGMSRPPRGTRTSHDSSCDVSSGRSRCSLRYTLTTADPMLCPRHHHFYPLAAWPALVFSF